MPITVPNNKRGTLALMCRVPLSLGNKIVNYADAMNCSINYLTLVLLEYAMEHAELVKRDCYELSFPNNSEKKHAPVHSRKEDKNE